VESGGTIAASKGDGLMHAWKIVDTTAHGYLLPDNELVQRLRAYERDGWEVFSVDRSHGIIVVRRPEHRKVAAMTIAEARAYFEERCQEAIREFSQDERTALAELEAAPAVFDRLVANQRTEERP
jgi:hypothetical protein